MRLNTAKMGLLNYGWSNHEKSKLYYFPQLVKE